MKNWHLAQSKQMDNHEPEGQTSATEIVDSGPIPSRVKPNTTKIGNHSFPA